MTIQGGCSPPPPNDMTAASRTLSCDKKQNFISTNELTQASLSVRIYLHLLATSLSMASCNSERSASVTIPNFPLRMPWSSGVWRSTRLIVHWNRCRKDIQLELHLATAFCKNAHGKTSSACSLSGNPNFCSQVSRVVISTNSSHFSFFPFNTVHELPRCGFVSITGFAIFRVARFTLQTRKLWLVGGCRDRTSRVLPLTCPNVKNF